jgi:subtilisin family serine protease
MSNRGPHVVLAAPGVDVLVAAPWGGYQMLSGTSFAAAEVSGVAALMLERRPAAKPDEIRAALLATSRAVEGGLRLIDAYAATLAEAPKGR